MFKSVSNSVSGEEDEFLNIKKTDEMKDRKGIALISDSKSKRKKKIFFSKILLDLLEWCKTLIDKKFKKNEISDYHPSNKIYEKAYFIDEKIVPICSGTTIIEFQSFFKFDHSISLLTHFLLFLDMFTVSSF